MVEIPLDPSAVVSLDHWRKRREQKDGCKHERYSLDVELGTVHCADCDVVVSAFHALKKIAFHESQAFQRLHSLKVEIAAISARQSWLRAVKALDRMWRGKRMLPCCPHCKRGLFAEDMDGAAVGVSYELARRKKAGERIPRNDTASADTHPQGEDSAQTEAPFMSGAVPEGQTPTPPIGDNHA